MGLLDKIIQFKGGLVPDFECENKGCSKRKRKDHSSDAPSAVSTRAYEPPPEVAAAMKVKCEEMRLKAENMLECS